MSESGNVVWPSANEPLWRFNWRLADAPDEEGVVITGAFYRGRQVFYKASLPCLRVQYDGPCGPYKDPLHYNNAKTTAACPSKRVCLYSYVSNGLRGLQVQSYHTVSAYRLTHRWVFWEDGQIYPRLYSAGLQCNFNHRHHVYWRFDFDIGGAGNDLALEYNTYTADQGWGRGWDTKTFETTRAKNPASRRSWAILDEQSGRGYHLIPGSNDGVADNFASHDLWLLRYHGSEDKNGAQGDRFSDDLQRYLNGENTVGQDIVLWYCAHLSHMAAHGGDEWHHAGPNLIPFHNWD